MASDAHIHPYYLYKEDGAQEIERIQLNIRCAASSFSNDEFIHNEALSKKEDGPFMALCFAVHPQLPARNMINTDKAGYSGIYDIDALLSFLETLAGEKRIRAVGEAGFDLFNSDFKETEKIQEKIFNHHLDIALRYSLPVVLHIRRAMHKIFLYAKQLKRLPAVVFHSYSGSLDEAASILRRGVNAYFSFGATIMMNHKNALRCAALLEENRLLFETDAPYQPLGMKKFSCYSDIFAVIRCAEELRKESGGNFRDRAAGSGGEKLENITDNNFNAVFGGGV
jgi:TatD DNase family protein